MFKPGAHWNIGSGSADDLARMQVLSIGCFYVRNEGGERYRCFNQLTGFEHWTYGTLEEIENNLTVQSKLWADKFKGDDRGSPWKAGWCGNGGKKKVS